MKTILTSIAIFTSLTFSAQTRVAQVEYTETIKMEITNGPKGVDLSGMLPKSMSNYKTLIFEGSKSIYSDSKKQETEEEDSEISSDDGSFQIKFMREESTDILYSNLSEKQEVHQTGFMGKSFVISDEITPIQWKIEAEKISYLGYECTKATGTLSNGDKLIAWFSPQIPVQCGPGSYHGLPGLILMVSVNDGKREIKATAIETKNVATKDIQAPNDGKKVTAAEFKKIEAEKVKELEQKYGGSSVIFRQ